eukprot:6259719-Amphidinium_carterae.1
MQTSSSKHVMVTRQGHRRLVRNFPYPEVNLQNQLPIPASADVLLNFAKDRAGNRSNPQLGLELDLLSFTLRVLDTLAVVLPPPVQLGPSL